MTTKETPIFIKGDIISLAPLNMDHVEIYARWHNDPRVRIYGRMILPQTVEEIKKWLEPKDYRYKRSLDFEIWHNQDEKPIGDCSVFQINWVLAKGLLGLTIGEPEYWGEGIATEATKLLIKYAFEELNLYKLDAFIYEPNIASFRCAEKNGFKRVATLEKDIYVDGKYLNTYLYSLLKEDWFKLQKIP